MAEDILILVETDDRQVVTLTLARPAARNALSPALVEQLHGAVRRVGSDERTRAVVLTGAGSAFSAGGDIASLAQMASWSYEDNVADSRAMDALFRAVDECPCPVICRVNGAAFGGGAGLVACADIAVASRAAVFAFSEVRVGIIPAVISTYVVPRIGVPWARRLMLTGERFDAERALQIGLVHEVVAAEDLDRAVAAIVAEVLAGWPGAQRRIKKLVQWAFVTDGPNRDAVVAATVEAAAEARTAEEGIRGLQAFLARSGAERANAEPADREPADREPADRDRAGTDRAGTDRAGGEAVNSVAADADAAGGAHPGPEAAEGEAARPHGPEASGPLGLAR